jgi:copper chaperone CopZ
VDSTYTVTGMTCQHCVNHVKEEVEAIAGVDDVALTLEEGRLVVTSTDPIDLVLIEQAVAEAGDYEVAPA